MSSSKKVNIGGNVCVYIMSLANDSLETIEVTIITLDHTVTDCLRRHWNASPVHYLDLDLHPRVLNKYGDYHWHTHTGL